MARVISEHVKQTRDLIRPVLEAATEPLATTQICELVNGWHPKVYIALCSLERDGEAKRAGRLGTAARAELLWCRSGSAPGTPTQSGGSS